MVSNYQMELQPIVDEKETKKFIKSITTEAVREFLDFEKLVKSSYFEEASIFSIFHYKHTGDFTYITKLLNIFKETQYYSGLLEWFCGKAGLEVKLTHSKLVFIKSSIKPEVSDTLSRYIKSKITIQNKAKLPDNFSELKSPQKSKLKAKKVDLLDSRLIVAGSFGSGKRR